MVRFKPDFLLVTVYCAATVYLFYPGFMSSDSFYQLSEARAGIFTDAHPPLMAILWRYLDKIFPGPFLPLVFQVLLISMAVSLIAISLFPASFSRRLAVYSVLILPPVWGFIGIVWKDIWMQVALLLSFALGMAAVRSRTKSTLLATSAFILLLGAAFRHNAIAAVPPLVWAISLMITRRHILAIVIGVAVTVLAAATNQGISKSFVKRSSVFAQVVWGFDIAGVSVQRNQDMFSGTYPSIMPQRSDISDIEGRYREGRTFACLYYPCGGAEPLLYQSQDARDLEEFKANWIYVITRYPVDYLRHRMKFALHVIGVASEPPMKAVEPYFNQLRFETEYQDNAIRRSFRAIMADLSSTPLFNVALYGVASLLGLAWSFLNIIRIDRQGLANFAAAGLFGSGILYEISIAASALTSDFRYSLWMITCAWIGACILFASKTGALIRRRAR